MEPTDAVPPAPQRPRSAQPDTPTVPATRTRAVLALVRPCSPNDAVIRAAADLAQQHGCALLVLGAVEPLATDWVDGVDIAGPVLEAAHGELFATCVELLWDRELVWGVNVLRGRVAAETRNLCGRVDIVRVVHGARRRPTVWRRLRRRLTGRLDRALGDLDLVVA